jgi:hypothetical protein
VIDNGSYAGGAPTGWFAIRHPAGLAYVRSDAIDFNAIPAEVHPCDDPALLRGPVGGTPVPRPWVSGGTPVPRPALSEVPAFDRPVAVGHFVPLHAVRIGLGFAAGSAAFQEAVAAQHRLGDSGPAITFTIGLTIYDVFAISGDVGGAFPDDNAKFSQIWRRRLDVPPRHPVDQQLHRLPHGRARPAERWLLARRPRADAPCEAGGGARAGQLRAPCCLPGLRRERRAGPRDPGRVHRLDAVSRRRAAALGC